MTAGPAAAVALIPTYLHVGASPVPANELLIQVIVGEGWETDLSVATEQAELWLARFTKRARRIINERNEAGQYCEFTFNSSAVDHLQGGSFVEGVDSTAVAAAKTRRLAHAEYVVALDLLTSTEPGFTV